MFKFLKKYTDEENLLRDSVSFDVSDSLLKIVTAVERAKIGKLNEKTILSFPFNTVTEEYPEFHFNISREQHDELVERFRTVQEI